MNQNQNETTEFGLRIAECGLKRSRSSFVIRHSSFPRAFTLTELLVVISIIAILATLITSAAVNALNRAKQASITLEIQQIDGAFEDFKNEYGAYPPNVYASSDLSTSPIDEPVLNGNNLLRILKKAHSRSTEFNTSVAATTGNNNVVSIVDVGLSPAESLVFWLQGFSNDVSRPLTGTDLEVTSIEYTNPVTGVAETPIPMNVVTIDTRQPRYDFDRGRLRMSRWPNGNRRFLEMTRANLDLIQIQLYEYLAPSSEEPFVYFDTSRETPEQVVNNWTTTEFFYSSLNSSGNIYPLKQKLANAPDPLPASTPSAPLLSYFEYVNARKFQILHCGLDDAWGDFSLSTGSQGQLDLGDIDYVPQFLFRGAAFGDIADTVGNFGTGTLEDAQE